MKNTNLLLGIDIGTYSSKGVITNKDGEIIAEDLVEHGLSLPSPAWAEHDAEKIWWHDFKILVKKLKERANISPRQISAVGVSALGPDLVPLDKEGHCLRPAILYGIDARAQKQIEKVVKSFGEEYILNLTGNSLSSQSIIPKMLWLRENEPEIFRKTDKILTATSFIVYKLTDNFYVDYLNASVAGLVDIRGACWATDLFKEFGFSLDLFPKLAWATEVAGGVTLKASLETGLKEGTPVIVGTCDAGAEAISGGVIEPGENILVYGSTISFLQYLKEPIFHPDLFSGLYCIPNSYFTGGATATGSALTKWFRDNFGHLEKLKESIDGTNAYDLLNEEVSQLESGPTGLMVLPFFSGARTPINDKKAKGLIAGLTLSHNKAQIYKAILEGVGFEIRSVFNVLEQAGANPKRNISVGGGIKNTVWPQIISDITGREQDCVAQALGAPLGSAFLAGLGAGIIKDIRSLREKWVKIERNIKPSAAINYKYEKYYQLYQPFYQATKDLIHKLGE